jgi:hypothetical protein
LLLSPTEKEYACLYNVNGTTVNDAIAYSAPTARIGLPDTSASDTGAKADESFVVDDVISPPRILKMSWLRPIELLVHDAGR